MTEHIGIKIIKKRRHENAARKPSNGNVNIKVMFEKFKPGGSGELSTMKKIWFVKLLDIKMIKAAIKGKRK